MSLRSGGEFRHIVALVDGRNEFTIEVVDAMGNNACTSVSILREGEVTTAEPSSTGSSLLGFVIGLIVGVMVAAAFFLSRDRRRGLGEVDEEPSGPPSPHEPPRPSAQPSPPPGTEEGGDWQEF